MMNKRLPTPYPPPEEAALAGCIQSGRPFGDRKWMEKMGDELGWREPLKRGRPKAERKP